MENPIQLDFKTIYNFLKKCDNLFIPKLSSIVNLKEYSEKLSKKSIQFCHYVNGNLVGMLAMYANDFTEKTAFITIMVLIKEYQGRGLAKQLLIDAIKYAKNLGFKKVRLEVYNKNIKAINLYKKLGFRKHMNKTDSVILFLEIDSLFKRVK